MVTELLNFTDMYVDVKQEISEEVCWNIQSSYGNVDLGSILLLPGVILVRDFQVFSVVPFKSNPYPQLHI